MGNAVLRREDLDLLTGAARFVADTTPAGTLHLAFVRSTMAHARIGDIDAAEARDVAGVVDVLTAGDLAIAPQPLFIALPPELSRLPLTDKARYVGDPIAAVVAESPGAAADGAGLVVVDYEPLPAVTDPLAALSPGAALVFKSHGSNQASELMLRHIAVDDCGRILNPLLVQGQVHGGIATGVSQALYERSVYDADGNPRNTNFADYAMPAASELPRFETAHTQTPTPLNPLGAKGIGESGTIGSTPAVQSAVLDALEPLGITHLDMPYTPERVWRAIAAAESATRRKASSDTGVMAS